MGLRPLTWLYSGSLWMLECFLCTVEVVVVGGAYLIMLQQSRQVKLEEVLDNDHTTVDSLNSLVFSLTVHP